MNKLGTPGRTSGSPSAVASSSDALASAAPLDLSVQRGEWMSSLTALRARRRSPLPWIGAAATVLAAALGAWWAFSRAPAPVATAPREAAPAPGEGVAPTLEGSDAQVRDSAAGISSSEDWSRWMSGADLVRRFVGALLAVADGESPRTFLPFLSPGAPFEAIERSGGLYPSPTSFARYDRIGQVVEGLDMEKAAAAWRALGPLLTRAHLEIAPPGRTLHQTLDDATAHLLAVPIPETELQLVERGALYAYADPAFERLTAAQKHLLRMGPPNARAVQAKLRQLRAALGMTAVP
jgi:hypothetical protein